MSNQKKLTIFGDSIAVGQGVSLNRTWVYKIADFFEDIFVTNASQNGRTTRQALENMPYEIQNHAPDFLIVQFGLNDCNFWLTDRGLPRVSKTSFLFNLIEIFDRAKNFGTSHVFFLTNHPTNRGTLENSVDYDESSWAYTETIKTIRELRSEAVIIDTWGAVDSWNKSKVNATFETLLKDGLHLSTYGHDVYFESISSVLKNYFI